MSADVRVLVEHLAAGPGFVDSPAREAEAAVEVVRTYRTLPRDRYDAIFVSCFGEPGVADLCALGLPVIGGRTPALREAAETGKPVSVILPNRELARHVAPHCGDVRVFAIDDSAPPDAAAIAACIARAIADAPGDHAIVLGCTAWTRFAAQLQQTFPDVQIIEPQAAAMRQISRVD